MSKITDGFEALVDRMEVLFPAASGWKRLPNPYKPEENNDRYLIQAYGLSLGPANNTRRLVNCQFSIERTIIITIARKYEGLENDDLKKAATELQLFEDQFALIKDLETDVTVNGEAMYCRYMGDSGLEYVKGTTDKFLMVRTEIAFEYLENFV